MPFYVGETVNKLSDNTLKIPFVKTMARNPIYTALFITAMVMVIFLIIFRDVESEESIATLSMRGGFWVFIMLIGTIFIHNKVLAAELEDSTVNKEYDAAFESPITTDEADLDDTASGSSDVSLESQNPPISLSDALVH